MCPCCCYWDRPGQLTKLQTLASVAFPGHVSFPPANGLLHDRALNLMPGPQVAEHWDHSPQSSHSVTGSVNSKHFCSMLPLASKNTWAFGQRAILSLCGVSNTWVGVIATRPSSHSEAVPTSWCAGWPASPLVPLTFDFWETEPIQLVAYLRLWLRYVWFHIRRSPVVVSHSSDSISMGQVSVGCPVEQRESGRVRFFVHPLHSLQSLHSFS